MIFKRFYNQIIIRLKFKFQSSKITLFDANQAHSKESKGRPIRKVFFFSGPTTYKGRGGGINTLNHKEKKIHQWKKWIKKICRASFCVSSLNDVPIISF